MSCPSKTSCIRLYIHIFITHELFSKNNVVKSQTSTKRDHIEHQFYLALKVITVNSLVSKNSEDSWYNFGRPLAYGGFIIPNNNVVKRSTNAFRVKTWHLDLFSSFGKRPSKGNMVVCPCQRRLENENVWHITFFTFFWTATPSSRDHG